MSTKTLTIVIPCYNVEKYIGKTLDSIIKCECLSQIEVIAVNDGSKDKTQELLEDFLNSFGELIIINKENGGHGSTINSGLKLASGKYFCVIDGDDWIDAISMDELVEYLKTCNSDMVITGHTREYINTSTSEGFGYSENRGFCCGVKYLNEHNLRIPMTDICYKTVLLKSVDLKIQEKTFYVDEEYCTIPFMKLETISFFSKGYYHYRIGEVGQSISPVNMLRNIDSRERVVRKLIDLLKNSELELDNYLYIKNKVIGLIKTVLEIYYIKYPNRKEGAIKGASFYRNIKSQNDYVSDGCRFYKMGVSLMNRIPGGVRLYEKMEKKKRENRAK